MHMTFEQFQVTGRDVADLSTIEHADCAGFTGPGRAYMDDDLFIERLIDGVWCLTIGSEQRTGTDLAALEGELYAFAVREGYIDAPAQE